MAHTRIDHPHRASGPSRAAVAGVVLLILGLGLWGLYRIAAGTEDHSFTPGGVAPTTVHVTANKTYDIAIPGGVAAETKLGPDPKTLECSMTFGSVPQALDLVAEPTDTKATNQIASFVAPVTGDVHIDCPELPAVFVDDADNASGDVSGLLLVLATIALTVGVGLALSALRRPTLQGRPLLSGRTAGEDDEIE